MYDKALRVCSILREAMAEKPVYDAEAMDLAVKMATEVDEWSETEDYIAVTFDRAEDGALWVLVDTPDKHDHHEDDELRPQLRLALNDRVLFDNPGDTINHDTVADSSVSVVRLGDREDFSHLSIERYELTAAPDLFRYVLSMRGIPLAEVAGDKALARALFRERLHGIRRCLEMLLDSCVP